MNNRNDMGISCIDALIDTNSNILSIILAQRCKIASCKRYQGLELCALDSIRINTYNDDILFWIWLRNYHSS